MNKADARRLYRDKRMQLSEAERSKMDDLMLIQFQRVDLPFLQSVLSYWPIEENHEPNTHLFTGYLKFKNPEIRICYPVADFNNLAIQAVATDIDTPFEKGKLNIHEPNGGASISVTEIEMVFVPLIIFDPNGYRVGYGKGFYDKYLAQCSDECIKTGFSYFEPVSSIDDRHDFDVPLDLCITPQNIYVF